MMLENMLDYVRITLYALLIGLGFLLYQAWQTDHPTAAATQQQDVSPLTRFVPPVTNENTQAASPATAASTPTQMQTAPSATGQIIRVQTDVFDIGIDTKGGDIVEAKLLQYPESLNSKTPFVLLNDQDQTRYIAESGLLSQNGPDTTQDQALYTSPQTTYTLDPQTNELVVRLNWQNNEGVKVSKIFTFTRGSYEVKVGYEVDNQSTKPWQGNLYTQLMRTDSPPPSQGGMMNLATYFGAAISTPDKPFEKIPFKDMKEKNLNKTVQDGWAAMIQHYFISAWVPNPASTSTYYSRVMPNGLYTVGMLGPTLNVAPGAKATTDAKLYTGPTIGSLLEKTAPHLKLTIDYGWFWFISVILFGMLEAIYNVVGNWGWAIVLVTIIIKIIFYPLSAKSYRSMSGLKRLQPRIEMLKERYGDDRQKLTQATLELYRQEKVNPMTGCLPVLVQIPVFIALYWVLIESVQLRQAPFILWIHDLSQHDPYYVLPLLMGIAMFLQQRLNPPPPDPMQAKIMLAMPVVFTFLFRNFPAGLMLYWFVNNALSFLQQWYIMRKINGAKK